MINAATSAQTALENEPEINPDWFVPKHMGERYYKVLAGLHDHMRPNAYVEIGIRSGDSLALAHCPTIGVDPRFIHPLNAKLRGPDGEITPQFKLFETTSDKFFAEEDARKVLGVPHIDFFFLDGAHLSDFLLRDLIASEKMTDRASIIALHDCVPIDIAMTLERKERAASPYPVVYKNYWAGDCWRVILMLKKYRPDIELHVMDSHPTGLVFLTNLDAASTVLQDNYADIVKEMKLLQLAEIGLRAYAESLPVRATADYVGADNLSKRFKPFNRAKAEQPAA